MVVQYICGHAGFICNLLRPLVKTLFLLVPYGYIIEIQKNSMTVMSSTLALLSGPRSEAGESAHAVGRPELLRMARAQFQASWCVVTVDYKKGDLYMDRCKYVFLCIDICARVYIHIYIYIHVDLRDMQ